MSVIADLSVPADEFALGEVLEVREGVQIRLESMVPTSDAVMPYFWAEARDADAIAAALRASPIVADASIVDRVGDEALFRVRWTEDVDGIIESLVETDAVVLDGMGRGNSWSFQLRFPGYDALSGFYRAVVDKGISLELKGVHNPIESSSDVEFGLTDVQRETLLLALEEGYFAVPRGATLVELAEQLDISDSAVSQRLRRGLTRLLAATLVREAPDR